jgi:hypothetical protein
MGIEMQNKKPNLIFPVISDVHIKTDNPTSVQKFTNTFEQLNQIFPKQDAFVVVGDLTEDGADVEYDKFMDVVRSNLLPEPELLINIGNHDYWNGLPRDEAQAKFLNKTGMEAIYFKKVINGYSFIMLGTEDGCTEGSFSLQQIQWLDQQLQEIVSEDTSKPIFVFHHQPLTETMYGSHWGIIENRQAFYDVMKKYPQVISFSGHTHFPLDNPSIIHQEDFTSVGTSTGAYLFLDDNRIQGEIPEGANDLNQAWIVEVYDEKVVLHRRDIHRNRWTGEPFEIKCPIKKEDFCYTNGRDQEPPYFETDSEISVIEKRPEDGTVTISFTQAKDNLWVKEYKVKVLNKENGEKVKELLVFSEFYKDPIPNPLVITINELTPTIDYDFEVWAVDAFENISVLSLKTMAKSKSL